MISHLPPLPPWIAVADVQQGEKSFDSCPTPTHVALPEHLLVHVPGSTVHFDGLPVGTFPVRAKSESINVHGACHGHGSKMHVSQFPVKLNFAWTCHKLQGKIELCIVLGATKQNPKLRNFIYTALSRVRSDSKTSSSSKGVKLALHVLSQTSEHYAPGALRNSNAGRRHRRHAPARQTQHRNAQKHGSHRCPAIDRPSAPPRSP